MTARFVLEGSRVVDIPSFYGELNRLFMAAEDWDLGPSLDALDDLLHAGHGELRGHDEVVLVWKDMAHIRAALGVPETTRWLQYKLDRPDQFSPAPARRQLEALQQGIGKTYFDLVLEIIASHPHIHLQPA